MVTRRTTPKAKAAAMLKSFEADYKTAYKTKNPQLLEKYFKDLSEDHLKQLCNSANIDARKRETRVAALAAALLERKTIVQTTLPRLMMILRTFGYTVYGVIAIIGVMEISEIKKVLYWQIPPALPYLLIVFGGLAAIDTLSVFIKSIKQYGTTKASRRLLRQMRALHTVRAPSKTSKTKKSS